MARKILVADDEANITNIIAYNLKKEGYQVIEAFDGKQAYELTLSENPDLILLDIMMPEMDGYETCKKIRETLDTPIIMLTARAEEVDKVLGLELGADDYVTKPFSIRELMARVKANLRRSASDVAQAKQTSSANVLKFGNLEIDLDAIEVRKNGNVLDLTIREFELIKFLSQNKGQVFSREALLEKVWGYEYFGDARTVDVTVRRLREKVETDASKPEFILTRRGAGYYFKG